MEEIRFYERLFLELVTAIAKDKKVELEVILLMLQMLINF